MTALGATAETCKYQGADGQVIYTNIPIKNATKLSCFSSEDSRPINKSATKQPTPSSFPRVDSSTQKQRDEGRRKILEDELEAEQKALEQAKKDYAEAEEKPEVFKKTIMVNVCETKVVNGSSVKTCKDVPQETTGRNVAAFEEKMQKFQEAVDSHNKNIQMLQKELASIK